MNEEAKQYQEKQQQIQKEQMQRMEQYQRLAQSNKQILENLQRTRQEAQKIVQYRQDMQRARQQQIKLTQQKMKTAIKNRDFKAVAKYAHQSEQYRKESRAFRKVAVSTHKVNRLNRKNIYLNQKIDKQIGKMAMREAKANNFITKKIAQTQNKVESVKLKYMMNKSERLHNKTERAKGKHNELMEKNKHYQSMENNKELQKIQADLNKDGMRTNQPSKPINQQALKDYAVDNKNNVTTYTHNKTGVKVKDNGNQLTASGGNNQERVQSLLKVAKAKGWDLSKVNVQGSPEFKKEAQKQIKAELDKQQLLKKVDDMQKVKSNNEKALKQQQEQKKEQKQERSFSK